MKVQFACFLILLICFFYVSPKKHNLKHHKKTNVSDKFALTCNVLRFDGTYLRAICLNKNQELTSTKVDLTSCIANDKGNLKFNKEGGFQKTSKSCILNGSSFKCQVENGADSKEVSLDLSTGITNNDGQLQCDVNPSKVIPTKKFYPFSSMATQVFSEVIVPGQAVISNNFRCYFTLTNDCNLAVYSILGHKGKKDKLLWSSKTNGKGTSCTAALQIEDGNLVLQDNNSKVIWKTDVNTEKKEKGPFRLHMQDNCDLAIYNERRVSLWNTKTALPPKNPKESQKKKMMFY